MDIKAVDARATADEREAVDALLGAPRSSWDGGPRGNPRDAHVATVGGRDSRAMRHLLLPALQALQARVGWISEGGLGYVSDRLNVPPADAWGVATFYALLATSPRPTRVVHVCDDVACKCKGADELIAALERSAGPAHGHPRLPTLRWAGASQALVNIGDTDVAWMRSPCLGMCDRAPAALVTIAGVHPHEQLLGDVTADIVQQILNGGSPDAAQTASAVVAQTFRSALTGTTIRQPVSQLRLLRRVGRVDPTSLDAYRASGGFTALAKAREMGGASVIGEVTSANMLGRGGAAFPTGRKWTAVRTEPVTPHYLICNADESEPGTFKDRVLMEEDPFALVEAMTIAAFATGCRNSFIYIRGEYPLAAARVRHAIDASRAAGLLPDFDIEIRRGAGAYICGEETALFESIEGRRGEPRNKPPFPVHAGLFGKPTVVNNVETLANVPHIVLEGGAAFASIGTAQSTGTRLFCLSGNIQNPGVYEAPHGITLRSLVEMAGGLSPGRTLRAVLLGGAAGTFLRPDELDLRLTHEDTRAAGTTLGSGVVMVVDDTVDLRDLVLRIAAFFRDESCGQCVPCRVGTVRQEEALHRIAKARTRGGLASEIALLDEVGAAMKDASICGLGQTAYAAVESAIKRLRLYDVAGVK
ncbi:MAG TPA: NAD(P)H-dependent oxidoreductase subunit E [Vicinamibacterales bacterium]|nr:NAD(P)H-dependent oxidoreductase subunit E [Vicinamibacterales bacterium]